jgi:hypothetical protein
MQSHRTFSLALILGYCALALSQTQVSPQQSVSSDDISVADGLQLPTYGHVWALDTWKGIHELVRLRPPDTSTDDSGFSLKLRRTIEFKGEAARVRVHDAAPQFFLRGVSGSDDGRSDLVVVRLSIEGERRTVTKDAMAQLKQREKHGDSQYPDVIGIKQQRVGTTDWYRLSPRRVRAGAVTLQSRVRRRRDFRLCHRSPSARKFRSTALGTVSRLGMNHTRQ